MFIFYTTEFEPKGCPNHYYTIKIPRYNFIKNRDRQIDSAGIIPSNSFIFIWVSFNIRKPQYYTVTVRTCAQLKHIKHYNKPTI